MRTHSAGRGSQVGDGDLGGGGSGSLAGVTRARGAGARPTWRTAPPAERPTGFDGAWSRIVKIDGFCDDVSVEREREQERELRRWAVGLAGAGEADRRAMGKAILMLLERIDSLRAELERRPAEAAVPASEPELVAEAEPEPEADQDEDTMVVGLRERLRAVTHRNHG